MNTPNGKNPLSYLGVTAPQPPNWVTGSTAPSATLRFPGPTLYIDSSTDTVYATEGDGVFVTLGIGSSGDVVAVNGTANQITASTVAGVVTLSLPAAITAPGSLTTTTTLAATTTITAGTGITATTGNIVASTGNITSTAGSVSAATTVTAGTGITATTGDITATAGQLFAGGDSAGVASTISITNTNDNTIGAGAGSIKMATGNAADNAIWVKIYIGVTPYWIPAWTTNAP